MALLERLTQVETYSGRVGPFSLLSPPHAKRRAVRLARSQLWRKCYLPV